ncbi:hypothetical protein HHI36_008812 [Cryptolaemus montrouzieri]|uniref:acid phosphatase n=1 Tax=Cryptolaemus montrouzieri TaxID=559131 RepID=A0ABD2MU14_9CUCU
MILFSFWFLLIVVGCDELVSVIVLFRHGVRTPLRFHPTDPYQNISYWSAPPGELTEEGRIQVRELGKWVQQRYKNILPEQYSSRDFFIISSNFSRTRKSAEAFCSGLYSSMSSFQIQTIPISSKATRKDHIIAIGEECRKYAKLKEELLHKRLRNFNEKHAELYQYISENAGLNVTSVEGLEKLYDAFYIEDYHNLTLPDWVKNIYPHKLHDPAFMSMLLTSYTKEIKRLIHGPLLNEILIYLKSFTNESNNQDSEFLPSSYVGRKMLAISGHDSNIIGILKTLNTPNLRWLQFSNSLLFELKRKDTSELYVNLLYKNGTELKKINVGTYGFNCDLNDFEKFLKPFLITESQWKKECETSN